LYSLVGKIPNVSCRLEFDFTNNVTEFEALMLGIENAYNLGCGHLTIFGDSELVVNLVHKIYYPSNTLMKCYTQTVWALISKFLSFNITCVKRELNSMVDRLVVFEPLLLNKFYHKDLISPLNICIILISLSM
jgi:ribonuclease HI